MYLWTANLWSLFATCVDPWRPCLFGWCCRSSVTKTVQLSGEYTDGFEYGSHRCRGMARTVDGDLEYTVVVSPWMLAALDQWMTTAPCWAWLYMWLNGLASIFSILLWHTQLYNNSRYVIIYFITSRIYEYIHVYIYQPSNFPNAEKL